MPSESEAHLLDHERTYHALLDATALAKPADEGGRVLIQTSLPSHHAITGTSLIGHIN